MSKKSTIYLCDNCGNEFSAWAGKCSMCGEWNTLKEIKVEKTKARRADHEVEYNLLKDISMEGTVRSMSGIGEFDRVLGGGIVPGSAILLGGEPGIGKSTLLLQIAEKVHKTIYLSAEESASQIKLRASRMGISGKEIRLASDCDVQTIEQEIAKEKPNLIIIDSIQTIMHSSFDATPGSLIQVRECGIYLQQLAKKSGIPIIIIGHVTKEGNLAGPRMLEHLVDTVLYLEGERFNNARILRGVKNRFGATNEVGIFSMQGEGMVEVKNPSDLFLSERINNPGSVITVVLQGTRPILIELQALVVPTHFGYPKRTSSGFDLNRLNLLAAVISKKTNLNLANFDIYLNVVGGMKINEPAADLAVCAAIISSVKNHTFSAESVFIGEVGLSGEVRKVTRQQEREKEAKALGFQVVSDIKEIGSLVKMLG